MTDTQSVQSIAALVNQASADPLPLIDAPPSGVTQLMRGIEVGDTWLTEAEVRELNGDDEEALARFDLNKEAASSFFALLLGRAVVRIGDMKPDADVINDLIIGDRDLLFLRIIEATYGRKREFELKCPECNENNTVVIDLRDDFPLRHTDIDPKAERHEVTLRNGDIVQLRLPTGRDQRVLHARKVKTAAEGNTTLLAECVEAVNGKPPANNLAWARSLGVVDRRKLVEFFRNAPGPQMEEVTVPCASCSFVMNVPVDWADLLWA